jgi:hypothetical protein
VFQLPSFPSLKVTEYGTCAITERALTTKNAISIAAAMSDELRKFNMIPPEKCRNQ